MSRRYRQDPCRNALVLNTGDCTELSDEELAIILRAADEVVNRGCRTILAKLLKGSREQSVFEHHLDQTTSYGKLSHLTIKQIGNRIDLAIQLGYLYVYYDKDFPYLAYTDRGWELERGIRARELADLFFTDCDVRATMAARMESIANEVAFETIALIGQEGEPSHIPALEAWRSVATRKIRPKLGNAIRCIQDRHPGAIS